MLDLAVVLQGMIWLAAAAAFFGRRQATLFHPCTLYLAFHGIVFVLRPLAVHFLNFDLMWNYIGFYPSPEDLLRALAASSASLVVFLAACLRAGKAAIVMPPSAGRRFREQEIRGLLITAGLLAPLIAYSIYETASGIKKERVGSIYILSGAGGYIVESQQMALPLIASIIWVYRFRLWTFSLALFYVAYRVWFGWARWTIIVFVLLLVLLFCWQRRRLWLPVWMLLLFLPVFILFNALGHSRSLFKMILKGAPLVKESTAECRTFSELLKRTLDTVDFANLDELTYVMAVVPARTGTYTYGVQYLALFTEPIPRHLWRDKPVGAPLGFFNLNAYGNFFGLVVGLPGDGWLSGGWLGMCLTMAAAGWVVGRAHRWLWQNRENQFRVLIYMTGLAALIQLYRDGGISVLKFLLFLWLPVVVWAVITRSLANPSWRRARMSPRQALHRSWPRCGAGDL